MVNLLPHFSLAFLIKVNECLVDIGDGIFDVCLNMRAEFNTATRRVNVKKWGGETDTNRLSVEMAS